MKDFGLFSQVIKKGIQKIREIDSKAQDEFINITFLRLELFE